MITRIVEGADGARDASGVVVVVDVMRAFTTAAYAFAAGAGEIDLVATFPAEDVACATAVDAFDFAMRAEWSGRCWTARRFPPVDG